MTRILVCLDEYMNHQQLEYYDKVVEPSLTRAGYEIHHTTQTEILDQLVNLQPAYLLLFALRKQSSAWDIARRVRAKSRERSLNVLILMAITFGPEDSPDDPAYYALPEYQELYDNYNQDGAWDFGEWIKNFEAEHYWRRKLQDRIN